MYPVCPVFFGRIDSSSGCLYRRSFVGFVFLLLESVVIPAQDFIVVKMKVFSNSKPLSANLARKTLDMVSVFSSPHHKFKRGYWLVACGANTRDPKQPAKKKLRIRVVKSIRKEFENLLVAKIKSWEIRPLVISSAKSLLFRIILRRWIRSFSFRLVRHWITLLDGTVRMSCLRNTTNSAGV